MTIPKPTLSALRPFVALMAFPSRVLREALEAEREIHKSTQQILLAANPNLPPAVRSILESSVRRVYGLPPPVTEAEDAAFLRSLGISPEPPPTEDA